MHVCLEEWCSGWPRTQSVRTHIHLPNTHSAPQTKSCVCEGTLSMCVMSAGDREREPIISHLCVCGSVSWHNAPAHWPPGYRCLLWRWYKGQIRFKTGKLHLFPLLFSSLQYGCVWNPSLVYSIVSSKYRFWSHINHCHFVSSLTAVVVILPGLCCWISQFWTFT